MLCHRQCGKIPLFGRYCANSVMYTAFKRTALCLQSYIMPTIQQFAKYGIAQFCTYLVQWKVLCILYVKIECCIMLSEV